MSSRRPAARQADVARAVKGALAAGLRVSRVEIEGDKIVVYTGGGDTKAEQPSDFDTWKERYHARSA